ncbi:MAG: hypothetical protein JOZ47_13290 [Kutzneria sp.]|nr:hypothetical protein [Kutzneria sp.]
MTEGNDRQAEARSSVGGNDSDRELVSRIARGDRDAFATLYDRYRVSSYAVARKVCADASLAERAVEKAFLSIWRDPEAYDPGSVGTRSWLLAVVYRCAV